MMLRKWPLGLVLVFLWLCLLASTCFSSTIASTFDSGAEGWLVMDLAPPHDIAFPTYVADGGNPGGFIRTADWFTINAYSAPMAFLGDKIAYFGGVLSFDLRVAELDGLPYDAVGFSNGLTTLTYRGGLPVAGEWTTFAIPLTGGAGWWKDPENMYGEHLVAATPLDLLTVMSSLTAVGIQADWHDGPDQVDLDNVRMSTPVPLPGALALLASGLLGLGALRRWS